MGVFDNLKKAVWEEDPNKPSAQPPVVAPATPIPQTVKPGWSAQPVGVGIQVDPAMKAQILAELDKVTPEILKAFDAMITSFAALPMDEATRIQSAYIAFKATRPGDQSVKILQAVNAREAALPGLRAAFDGEMKNVEKQIAALERQLTELRDSVASRAAFEAAYASVAEEIQIKKQQLQLLKG